MKDNNIYKNKIEEVMTSAMNNLRTLVDVDIVVGKPIETNSSLTIIPLTKVTMGFVSGGGEYNTELREIRKDTTYPFSGGSGGGLSLKPVGFLVIDGKCVDLIKIESKSSIERLIETVPEVAKFISKNFSSEKNNGQKTEK